MKTLRSIILVTVPLIFFTGLVSIFFRIQHWVGAKILSQIFTGSLIVCLICSFLFALRYKPEEKKQDFDSF